jgi:hypothetical protein
MVHLGHIRLHQLLYTQDHQGPMIYLWYCQHSWPSNRSRQRRILPIGERKRVKAFRILYSDYERLPTWWALRTEVSDPWDNTAESDPWRTLWIRTRHLVTLDFAICHQVWQSTIRTLFHWRLILSGA